MRRVEVGWKDSGNGPSRFWARQPRSPPLVACFPVQDSTEFTVLLRGVSRRRTMTAATVAFMIGHDDDIVLNPSVGNPRRRDAPPRSSKWAGLQSDVAIVSAVQKFYPSLVIITLATVEELRATNASMVVIISYKTQPSFAWYSTFFETLNGLEARGTIVYPSCNFKQLISSKANYVRVLQANALPLCPTEILERAECLDDSGALSVERVERCLGAALRRLQLLPSPPAPQTADDAAAIAPSLMYLVSKPSNADGGFGVAFWEAAGPAARTAGITSGGGTENTSVQHDLGPGSACCYAGAANETMDDGRGPATAPLVGSLQLRTLLSNGCDLPLPPSLTAAAPAAAAEPPSSKRQRRSEDDGAGAAEDSSSRGGAFFDYLRAVGFVGSRPHVLLQPLVPQLAQHYEIKLYFLQRSPFYASLTYGKSQLLARVVRPSTHSRLFEYLQPLIAESQRALDALPPDGPHDPKILMRVDWGTGEPLLAASSPTERGPKTAARFGSTRRSSRRRAHLLHRSVSCSVASRSARTRRSWGPCATSSTRSRSTRATTSTGTTRPTRPSSRSRARMASTSRACSASWGEFKTKLQLFKGTRERSLSSGLRTVLLCSCAPSAGTYSNAPLAPAARRCYVFVAAPIERCRVY